MIKTAEVKPSRPGSRVQANLLSWAGLLLGVIILFLLLWAIAPNFATPRNLFNVLRAVAINGMIACAMTFVIISGDIDVSVGGAVAWASALLGVLAIKQHWPLALAVLFVIALITLVHSPGRRHPGQVGHPGVRRHPGVDDGLQGAGEGNHASVPDHAVPRVVLLLGPGLRLQGDPGAGRPDADHGRDLLLPQHAHGVRPLGLQRGRQRGSFAAVGHPGGPHPHPGLCHQRHDGGDRRHHHLLPHHGRLPQRGRGVWSST